MPNEDGKVKRFAGKNWTPRRRWSGPALSRRATSGASGGDSPMSGTSGIFTRNGSCSRHEYRAHPRFISQAMRPTPGAPESSAASAAASAGRRSDTRCSLFSPSPAWLGPIARNLSPSYDDPESLSCPKPGSALSRPAGMMSRGVARSRALLFCFLNRLTSHLRHDTSAPASLRHKRYQETFTVLSRRGFSSKRWPQ